MLYAIADIFYSRFSLYWISDNSVTGSELGISALDIREGRYKTLIVSIWVSVCLRSPMTALEFQCLKKKKKKKSCSCCLNTSKKILNVALNRSSYLNE